MKQARKKHINTGFEIQKAAMLYELTGVNLLGRGRNVTRSISSYGAMMRRKEKHREALKAATNDFLARGGSITVVDGG